MLELSKTDCEAEYVDETDGRADLDRGDTVVKSDDESETDDVTLELTKLEQDSLADEDPLDVVDLVAVEELNDVEVYEFRKFVADIFTVTLVVADADIEANADIVNWEADVDVVVVADLVDSADEDIVNEAIIL